MTNTLIVGLGNPLLGDDGVGWRVAEQVESQLEPPFLSPSIGKIDVVQLALGGLSLMENLIGYDEVILVDAIQTRKAPVGSVSSFPLETLPNRAAGHLSSAHDTTLHNALELGRSMGAQLPKRVMIVAIEADNVYDFSEILSPAVEAAVPVAVQQVLHLIQ